MSVAGRVVLGFVAGWVRGNQVESRLEDSTVAPSCHIWILFPDLDVRGPRSPSVRMIS